MDVQPLLLAFIGGGAISALVQAVFRYLETRFVETKKIEIETPKVEVLEKQADGAVAAQIAGAFGQLIKELREQIDDLREIERACQEKLDAQMHEIQALQGQVRHLQSELYRLSGGSRVG